MRIYCHGEIVPEDEAKISANDHGFLYGAALFETFRTYEGEPFLLHEHTTRLTTSCRSFAIVPGQNLLLRDPPDHPALRQTIGRLLEENGVADAVFRYTLSAGGMSPGLPRGAYENPTEILSIRPLPSPAETVRLHILNTTRTEPEVFPRPKSVHYINNLIAYRELSAREPNPGDEGLMLTRDGQIAEGVVSNIFLLNGNRLLTPPAAAHILEGITRREVLKLATESGMATAEIPLQLPDLQTAEAIFTTNSVRGILPIHEVVGSDGQAVWKRNSAGHPLVKALQKAYGP